MNYYLVAIIVVTSVAATNGTNKPTSKPTPRKPTPISTPKPTLKQTAKPTSSKPTPRKPTPIPTPKPTPKQTAKPTSKPIYDNSPTVVDSYGSRNYKHILDVQVRNQWDPNQGYCGETSTIIAGQLLAGQYFSQYDLRKIYCSNEGISNNRVCQTEEQYLVGDSTYDIDTATSIHMTAETYSATGTAAYLSWVKRHVRKGHVVTITVFAKDGTSDEYDHIVNVVGIETNFDDDLYHDSDLLIYDDHYDDVYRVSFKDFPMTRFDSKKNSAPQWSLPKGVNVINYGIAHTGPVGIGLKQVKLWTSVKDELPSIKEGQWARPTDKDMTVYVVVSGLVEGVEYNLFKYDDEKHVPENDFNNNSQDAVSVDTFVADSSGVYKFDFKARTSNKIIFRCVEAY